MQKDAHLENEGHFLVAAADVWRSAAAADRPAFSKKTAQLAISDPLTYFNIVLELYAQQLKKSSLNLQSTKEKKQKC